MTKLLSCPFCGGEADHHDIGNAHTKSRGTKIWCKSCFFSKTVKAVRHDLDWTRAHAITAWNTRALSATRTDLWEPIDETVRGPAIVCAFGDEESAWLPMTAYRVGSKWERPASRDGLPYEPTHYLPISALPAPPITTEGE